MKSSIYFLLVLFCCYSCCDSDDADGVFEIFDKPVLSDVTPVDKKIKEMFEIYQTYFKYEFTPTEYEWDWSQNSTSVKYSAADVNYVAEVIDSVQKWVFDVFPSDFIREYCPLNIFMADTLQTSRAMLNGDMKTNFVILAPVSDRFKQENFSEVREMWLSLFIEKMLYQLPYPGKFAVISNEGYSQYSYGKKDDVVQLYAILKKSRLGITSSLGGTKPTTVAQDFGDFVAFIVYKTPEQKQEYYAKNEAVRRKEALVKAYFEENFNIILPEPQ